MQIECNITHNGVNNWSDPAEVGRFRPIPIRGGDEASTVLIAGVRPTSKHLRISRMRSESDENRSEFGKIEARERERERGRGEREGKHAVK